MTFITEMRSPLFAFERKKSAVNERRHFTERMKSFLNNRSEKGLIANNNDDNQVRKKKAKSPEYRYNRLDLSLPPPPSITPPKI